MNPRLPSVLAVTVVLAGCARCDVNRQPARPPERQAIAAEAAQVVRLRATLEREGLWGFFERARSERWPTPLIRSKYWVDRLPRGQAEWASLEESKRALGKALAQLIDVESLALADQAGTKTREEQCERLLRAASWIRTSRGYGNLVLNARLDDLACVQIGHLAADLEYDLSKVDALFARIATREEDLRMRLAVLEEEAPRARDVPREERVELTNEQLAEWARREGRKAAVWCREHGIDISAPQTDVIRPELPDVLAFFVDDGLPAGPRTAATMWDQKHHRIYCVNGVGISLRQPVDALRLFRRKVGHFPTDPPADAQPYHTPIQAAFVAAWDPYHVAGYEPIGQSAAAAYEAIRANRLMDYETRQLAEERHRPSAAVEARGQR